MERGERFGVLIVAALTGFVMTGVVIIALCATCTAVQRILEGRRLLRVFEADRRRPDADRSPSMAGEQGGPRGFRMSDRGLPQGLPEMSFATLVLSLSTSALLHLGVPPEPGDAAPPEINLPLARQTIDILEILHEKTRGNLDESESHLLEQILHDLRMRFVAARKSADVIEVRAPAKLNLGLEVLRRRPGRLSRDPDLLRAAAPVRSAHARPRAPRGSGIRLEIEGG